MIYVTYSNLITGHYVTIGAIFRMIVKPGNRGGREHGILTDGNPRKSRYTTTNFKDRVLTGQLSSLALKLLASLPLLVVISPDLM